MPSDKATSTSSAAAGGNFVHIEGTGYAITPDFMRSVVKKMNERKSVKERGDGTRRCGSDPTEGWNLNQPGYGRLIENLMSHCR